MRASIRTLALASSLAASGCLANASSGEVAGELVVASGSPCVPLLAGQTIDVGTVCVAIADTDTSSACGAGARGALEVTYTTVGGWEITETQLAVGDSLSDIPTNASGSPQVGRFPYHTSSPGGVTTTTVAVPLCTLGLDASMDACSPMTAYVAAHAVVRRIAADGTTQQETAWSAGTRFVSRGTWATYSTTTLECRPPEPVATTCETAWARDPGALDVPFCAIECLTEARWGWTNGPMGPGSYRFELWAGGGGGHGCEPNDAAYVGVLDVVYDGATATLAYHPERGFTFDETHLYVGSAPVPSGRRGCTVAPGSFALSGSADGRYVVPGLSGPIYVAAHAVACGAY